MTSKILTGTYASGYDIATSVTSLTVASTGVVGNGGGLYALGPSNSGSRSLDLSIVNYGKVASPNAGRAFGILVNSTTTVEVTNGGAAYKGASISGNAGGVALYAPQGSVTNYGVIAATSSSGYVDAAIFMSGGGTVVNGSAADTTARLFGDKGVEILGSANVVNYGSIQESAASRFGAAYDGDGVLAGSGIVTNGSNTDRTAFIENATGVAITGDGSVNNFGTIVGESAVGHASISGLGAGIAFRRHGSITNGSVTDTRAVIRGATDGIFIGGDSYYPGVAIRNYGSILGANTPSYGSPGPNYNAGVYSRYESVYNGSTASQKALIEGFNGVAVVSAKVTNYGTIRAEGGDGVEMLFRGYVFNLGTASLIDGYNGLALTSGNRYLDVVNYGTIRGEGGAAISTSGYGIIINGASGVLEGYNGVVGITSYIHRLTNSGLIMASGAFGVDLGGTVQNFGSIEASNGIAASITGQMTNGDGGDHTALVKGLTGVELSGGAQLQNFGIIDGLGGTAVNVGVGDSLIIDPGCAFIGTVQGAGGGLTLDGGAGTISLTSTSNVVVSGSMAKTTFYNFATVDIDSSASEALAGNGVVAGSDTLTIAGALDVAHTLTLAANSATPSAGGQLSLSGTLSGAGTLLLDGGAVANFGSGADLAIGHVNLVGAAQANVIAGNLSYAGVWRQVRGTLSIASLATATFTGAGDVFEGAASGGQMNLTGGSDELVNFHVQTQLTISGSAAVSVAGTTTIDGPDKVDIEGGTVTIGIGITSATMTGGGALQLGDAAQVSGAAATTTLFNKNDLIAGGGQLGESHMRLTNEVGGVIEANSGTAALVINTGAYSVVNQGVLKSVAAGGMTIASAVVNNGTLVCDGGNMTLDKAVAGTGSAMVNNATLDFGSTFNQNVTFGATGVLELARSVSYHGVISGFSTTGTTSLDLRDIALNSNTSVAYSGTTSGGVLTVTDGAHTAKINLSGDFTSSTFNFQTDGAGGVLIKDPTTAKSAPATAARLVEAAAGLAGGGGSALYLASGVANDTRMLSALATSAA